MGMMCAFAPRPSMNCRSVCVTLRLSLRIQVGYTRLVCLVQQVSCFSCVKTWGVTMLLIKLLGTDCCTMTFPTPGISLWLVAAPLLRLSRKRCWHAFLALLLSRLLPVSPWNWRIVQVLPSLVFYEI